jgi:GT2 family glycosyltransferase
MRLSLGGNSMTEPGVSVVVPTRNRPDQIEACIMSIMANPGDDYEIVVSDQSKDDATERSLEAYASDPRFRYVRTKTRGSSSSRNVGITSSRAPILAFTDDDCRVSFDWLANIRAIFARDTDVAAIFGKVSLPDGATDHGYAAEFEPHRREVQHDFPEAGSPWGISANMAIRRRVLEQVGLFDPVLGAGTDLFGGEDTDLTIRILAAGFKIVNAREVFVRHLGVRAGKEASKLCQGYGQAIGAVLAKHVRIGTKNSARLLASWVTGQGAKSLYNAVTGKRPTGLRFVSGLMLGIVRSLGYGVDRDRQMYVVSS